MASHMFERALELTLSFEGGYSDHSLDPGGATNLGITRAALESHRGKPVSKSEVMALSRAEAAEIYRAEYWDAVAGDKLPEGVDLSLFDFAVNSGPSRAIKIAQAALGVRANGVMTAETLERIVTADHAALVRSIARGRLSFLQRLAIFVTFGRGWTKRVKAVESASLAMITDGAAGQTDAASTSSHESTIAMNGMKPFLASRTVWANLIGLAALILAWFGFQTDEIDQGKLVDAVLQTVAAGSFIASTVFRMIADKKIG